MNIKKIIEDLIDPFLKAGDLSISLREKGLKKEMKLIFLILIILICLKQLTIDYF